MLNLEDIIKENAKAYYTTGKQRLSDEVFDAVVDEIKSTMPNSNVVSSTGWGYKPDSENKIKHKYCHIGSLNKIKTINELLKLNTKELNISAKLDGMSCVLYYENGTLVNALTRGDGEFGIDIFDKVKCISGCSTNLVDTEFTGAVRGEIFMTPTAFDLYKKYHPNAANPRNSTAGIINSNDITPDYKFLSLYVYTIVANEKEKDQYTNTVVSYDWLKNNFEFVTPYCHCNVDDITEDYLIQLRNKYQELVVIDGLVITNKNILIGDGIYKYDQVAWKFQDEVKLVKVKNIEWTMSKNNVYVPVIIFENPIELEGTKVKKATGYNAKWVIDTKIQSGSVVAVKKANQIIPTIIEVLT